MGKPAVSICCITYNHEKYIRDALNSFLMQKTNFPIEILIHDDASTDGTANIIREYEAKYPDIIKTIYQTVNQYSQGKDVSQFNFNRAQGKYIALCEGDDYWCDPQKLQRQFDYMESHPACTLCMHGRYSLDADARDFFPSLHPSPDRIPQNGALYARLLIKMRYNTFYFTASMFFPKKVLDEKMALMQRDTNNGMIWDFMLAFYMAVSGEVHYIKRRMGVYRIHMGSATHNFEEQVASFQKGANHLFRVMAENNGLLDVWTASSDVPPIQKVFSQRVFLLRTLRHCVRIAEGKILYFLWDKMNFCRVH